MFVAGAPRRFTLKRDQRQPAQGKDEEDQPKIYKDIPSQILPLNRFSFELEQSDDRGMEGSLSLQEQNFHEENVTNDFESSSRTPRAASDKHQKE